MDQFAKSAMNGVSEDGPVFHDCLRCSGKACIFLICLFQVLAAGMDGTERGFRFIQFISNGEAFISCLIECFSVADTLFLQLFLTGHGLFFFCEQACERLIRFLEFALDALCCLFPSG